MPSVKKGEPQKKYVNRCVPIVLHEGTTKDPSQAAAICHSMWREHQKKERSKSSLGIPFEDVNLLTDNQLDEVIKEDYSSYLIKKAITEI